MEMLKNRQIIYENIEPEYRKLIDLAKSKQVTVHLNFIFRVLKLDSNLRK